jgi:hypothetical protein
MKGKKKAAKAPTKVERQELLRERIIRLTDELEAAGFGNSLKVPTPAKPIAPELSDARTDGFIGHIEEELGTYVQRVSVADNFYQRQPFDHLKDKIYRRLIRDFINGAAMPEAKVAALDVKGGRLKSLQEPGAKCSIIDGLQRLYCYCIAILIVWRRETLIEERCIPADAWDYLKEAVESTGDPKTAVETLLKRTTRYELFWNIDLEGLLHYMVTFNTGQRRMSLEVQLEIMQRPLLKTLQHDAKIQIFQDTAQTAGKQKPKHEFAASDLVIARYPDNPNHKYILSNGGVFLVSFAAACGKIRSTKNMTSLDGELQRLMKELTSTSEDPWNLDDYHGTVNSIKTSRGKSIRRIVYPRWRTDTGAQAVSSDHQRSSQSGALCLEKKQGIHTGARRRSQVAFTGPNPCAEMDRHPAWAPADGTFASAQPGFCLAQWHTSNNCRPTQTGGYSVDPRGGDTPNCGDSCGTPRSEYR